MDGRFAPDDPLGQVEDEFVMRRVRAIMQGRIAKYFEFRVMPDFGNGTTVLYDAYLDVRFSQAFRVRLGKDKTPVGLEQLYSDYALLFPERSLASNLVPNRDVGVQVQGRVAATSAASSTACPTPRTGTSTADLARIWRAGSRCVRSRERT
jgi:phosphate-selective porin OprO/OprP